MHALNNFLLGDPVHVARLGDPRDPQGNSVREIFDVGQNWAEAGHSFEEDIFGGSIYGLENQGNYRTSTGAALIGQLAKQPRPTRGRWSREFCNVPYNSVVDFTVWPIPGIWSRSMASHDFWQRAVAKFGAQALKAPKILVSESSTEQLDASDYQYPVATSRQQVLRWDPAYSPAPHHVETMKGVARTFTAKQLEYSRKRPWAFDRFAMWQMTPWSWGHFRTFLYEATNIQFVRRGKWDEYHACYIMNTFMWPLQLGNVPPQGSITPQWRMLSQSAPVAWFWRAVGCLMWAAMPARQYAERVQQQARPSAPFDHWVIHPNATFIDQDERTLTLQAMACVFKARWQWPAFDLLQRHNVNGWLPTDVRMVRKMRLTKAVQAFAHYKSICKVPAGLESAFSQACAAMEVNVENDHASNYTSWLDFTFNMPEYPGVWEDGTLSKAYDNRFWAMKEWKGHLRNIPDDEKVVERYWGPDAISATQTAPAWANTGVAGRAAPPGEPFRRHEIRYYTVAELYDLERRLDEPLVLVRDGIDLNVHRLSEVQATVGNDNAESATVATQRSYYGLELTPQAAERFRDCDPFTIPLGKVVKAMREAEVSFGSGRNGQPRWILLGRTVYDITHLVCRDDQRLFDLLQKGSGGNPSESLTAEGYDVADVIKSLEPWKVGILPPQFPKNTLDFSTLQIYTPRTLRRHEFKRTSMRVSIANKVYDITEYADSHPGGLRMLEEHAGEDVTQLFQRYHHSNNLGSILDDMEELWVGNLVASRAEISPSEVNGARRLIGKNEIRFREIIYSVEGLENSHSILVAELRPYLGTDATDKLIIEQDDGPLMRLARMKNYAVAMVELPEPSLPEMNVDELRRHNGIVSEDQTWRNAAYTAFNDVVYDVTEVYEYAMDNPNLRGLGDFIGYQVTEGRLGAYLEARYSHRAVAKFVRQPTRRDKDTQPWDARRQLAGPIRIPKWDVQPRQKPPPADDAIAPYPEARDIAMLDAREFGPGKPEVFPAEPSHEDREKIMLGLHGDAGYESCLGGASRGTSRRQPQRDTHRRSEERSRGSEVATAVGSSSSGNRPGVLRGSVPQDEGVIHMSVCGGGRHEGDAIMDMSEMTGDAVPTTPSPKRKFTFEGDDSPHGDAAYYAIKGFLFTPGQYFAISGACGGLAALAVAYARATGYRVIAVDAGHDKAEIYKAKGAEHYVDVTAVVTLGEKILNVTNGKGAKAVVVTTTSVVAYQQV
ncbi:Alcohol dehydrogenase 1 [Colletotrichum spinosum]|uniref:Alcohol dehydrogenase 1 n=1 Tax=Colletotrichum spinosum TaxID=1347390 RepID=A0A4R8QEW7_9PEZI|nr:Alcohol dehydrogenase 1 [Colletotrichum spinosum]